MAAFKVVRGIFRSFVKRLPEFKSGSGQVAPKAGCQLGDRCLTTRQQLVVCSPSTYQRNVAAFARTVFDGIAGRGGQHLISQASQLRHRAVLNLLQKSGSRLPLFAFLGFAYANSTTNPPPHVQEQEQLQQLHQLVQKAFRTPNSVNGQSASVTQNISHQGLKLKDYDLEDRLGERSSNSAVYTARHGGNEFAVKMLFNYCAQSNSISLYRTFAKEHEVLSTNSAQDAETIEGAHKYTNLPAHENIVPVLHTFADDTPLLPDAVDTYPAALPSRHHTDGIGRNRSLFLVMPRYSRTVRQYVTENPKPDLQVSTLLLLQLLEGISHITEHGVAHRDLKTDNLLLDESEPGCPRLVICDFGCCLADRRLGLTLPYATDETDRGGNAQLMAPEVASVTPGEKTAIDYSKSDAWAAGSIAYELFGDSNPFYLRNLDSRTYQEEEIPLLSRAPPSVRRVVSLLLKKDPHERISAGDAVTMLHVILWAPPDWLANKMEYSDVVKWLLTHTLRQFVDQESSLEHKVFHKFLQHATPENITRALEMLRE